MEPTGIKFFDQSIFMTMEAACKMAENSVSPSLQPIQLGKDKISAVLVKADGTAPERVVLLILHDLDDFKAIDSEKMVKTVRKQLSGLLTDIVSTAGYGGS